MRRYAIPVGSKPEKSGRRLDMLVFHAYNAFKQPVVYAVLPANRTCRQATCVPNPFDAVETGDIRFSMQLSQSSCACRLHSEGGGRRR